MSIEETKLAIVIPTYNRPLLLKQLLEDIIAQTIEPNRVVIVDGNPSSKEVENVLETIAFPPEWAVIYVPSLMSNAPFQRYLGSRSVADSDICVFLDDDIRLLQKYFFQKIIAPLITKKNDVVGVTSNIVFPNRPLNVSAQSKSISLKLGFLKKPGSITPVGNRLMPLSTNDDYVSVEWMRGGVMACSVAAMAENFFSEDVFAMSHIGAGLGVDDTYISRRIGQQGDLLLCLITEAVHPDQDTSQAYPSDSKGLGFARAYSRRFLNDHYRLDKAPRLSDRLFFIISQLRSCVLSWWKAGFSWREREKVQYAIGFTQGMLMGFMKEPKAEKLLPGFDWRAKALASIDLRKKIQ